MPVPSSCGPGRESPRPYGRGLYMPTMIFTSPLGDAPGVFTMSHLPRLAGVLALALTITTARADDAKKSPDEGKKGTVTGVVTAKGEAWIEVKADGEEKARKYTPHWKGGL